MENKDVIIEEESPHEIPEPETPFSKINRMGIGYKKLRRNGASFQLQPEE
jgi:hypothetical protein